MAASNILEDPPVEVRARVNVRMAEARNRLSDARTSNQLVKELMNHLNETTAALVDYDPEAAAEFAAVGYNFRDYLHELSLRICADIRTADGEYEEAEAEHDEVWAEYYKNHPDPDGE